MFHEARLKLTAWYLLILMAISVLFSAAIYNIVTEQIEGFIQRQNDRVQRYQEDLGQNRSTHEPDHDDPPLVSTEELEEQEKQLLFTLFFVNGFILLIGGGASYFLAGRTLQPIKLMIDEQNQFISSSSHELRTPIATMRTEMEGSLLEKHISDSRARELITSNLEELGSLQILTNNLLKLAQIHNIISQKFTEEVSITDVIDRAMKKVSPLAKKKHITLQKNLHEAIILGDKRSLIETFVILLENAIKYSEEKTMITVGTKKINQAVKISVSDQGVGIAKEDLPYIFNRFYRADKSHTTDGFGLGLSIAKKTVERHNGSIHVESSVGKGTTFTLTFPLKQ